MELYVSIGSALLSIIAIVISIAIAHRQNKIALFQIKFSALTKIHDLINYASVIDSAQYGAELFEFDRFFGTSISDAHISNNDKMIQVYGNTLRINNEFEMAFSTSKKQIFKDVQSLTKNLENCAIDTIKHNTNSTNKNIFVNTALTFAKENEKELSVLSKL